MKITPQNTFLSKNTKNTIFSKNIGDINSYKKSIKNILKNSPAPPLAPP